MNKAAKSSLRPRTIREAATQIGVERRILKNWLREFPVFGPAAEKDFSESDMLVARALKRLIVEEGVSSGEARQMFEEAGTDAVVAAYGAPPERADPGNPALALQAAVRSAAAAGFFGAVVAELNIANESDAEESPVASYAQARLARLAARD